MAATGPSPTVPTRPLNNGVEIPQLGFGVFQIPPAAVAEAVGTALLAGYRLVDTAAAYGNEEGVGAAIATSGLTRDELFVTTKLWNTDHGADRARAAFEESRRRLGLDVVELYLIHWPVPRRDRFVETWRALEEILGRGAVRAIGVSNFRVPDLERLLEETEVVPAVNQIELHPGFPQDELRAFHAEHGIVTEAWSPLGQGGGLLEAPALLEIARAHGRTPAQVVIRWHVQLGNVVIPKSVTPERIRSNLDVFDFALDDAEMAALVALPGRRIGPHPDSFAG